MSGDWCIHSVVLTYGYCVLFCMSSFECPNSCWIVACFFFNYCQVPVIKRWYVHNAFKINKHMILFSLYLVSSSFVFINIGFDTFLYLLFPVFLYCVFFVALLLDIQLKLLNIYNIFSSDLFWTFLCGYQPLQTSTYLYI